MRNFLCLLMLAVYVTACECTADTIPEMNFQMAEISDDTTKTTEEPTTSTEEPTTLTEEPTTLTKAPTKLSSETIDTTKQTSSNKSTGTPKTDNTTSAAEAALNSKIVSTNLTSEDPTNVSEVVKTVKAVKQKDGSILSATSVAFALVVTLYMMVV